MPGDAKSGYRLITWASVLDVDVEHVEDHTAYQTDVVVRMITPPRSDHAQVSGGIIFAVLGGRHLAAWSQGEHWNAGTGVEDRRPLERLSVELGEPLKVKLQCVLAA